MTYPDIPYFITLSYKTSECLRDCHVKALWVSLDCEYRQSPMELGSQFPRLVPYLGLQSARETYRRSNLLSISDAERGPPLNSKPLQIFLRRLVDRGILGVEWKPGPPISLGIRKSVVELLQR